MWPDNVITSVTDHEKIETHEITLNELKMMRLHENKFSLATARKDQLMGSQRDKKPAMPSPTPEGWFDSRQHPWTYRYTYLAGHLGSHFTLSSNASMENFFDVERPFLKNQKALT